jgi:hypothetical protein
MIFVPDLSQLCPAFWYGKSMIKVSGTLFFVEKMLLKSSIDVSQM